MGIRENRNNADWPRISGRKVVLAFVLIFGIAFVMLLVIRYAVL